MADAGEGGRPPAWDVRRLLLAGLGLAGAGLTGAALFAMQLGLDTNQDWGPSRRLLLAVGLLCVAAPLAPLAWGRLGAALRSGPIARLAAAVRSAGGWAAAPVRGALRRLSESSAARRARRAGRSALARVPGLERAPGSDLARARAAGAVVGLLALTAYVWIGSAGYWTRWPTTTSHFDLLAQGFLHGQLSLMVEPPPELLALPDPYGMESRQFLPSVWDVSFYRGKFYLYWGPVPAAAAAGLRLLGADGVSDAALALLFLAASLAACLALILAIWRDHFREQVGWSIAVPVMLAAAFSNPLPWLMARPSVYEAAIAAGQCFLLVGLYVAYRAVAMRGARHGWLALAGASWGLAVASRLTLLPAVVFLTLVLAWRLGKGKGQAPAAPVPVRDWLALGLPLLACVALLGAYNFARFGSVLESGHRYQLGRWDKFHSYNAVLALGNLIPNLYNYLLNPPALLNVFPYLKAHWGAYYIWIVHTYAPEHYHTEQITGLLVGSPFVWLATVPLTGALSRLRAGLRRAGASASEGDRLWLTLSLLGAPALALAPLMVFVSSSMRHLADLVPMSMLLAGLGAFRLAESTAGRGRRRRVLTALIWLLAGLTALAGLLLAMTGQDARLERLNPALFEQLTRWFTW